jgi:mRNA-degrading endonuclease YafQ of YafQ-DinJ toxin-antitoxin module
VVHAKGGIMEKIDRHNYEAYFLDYLEGNLSAEDKQDLFSFLDKNPDLKSALEMDLNEVSLNPSAIVFENKESLKTEDESILTLNTADAWMLESVEKNLIGSKQKELEDFVRKHQLEKTYTAYQSTVLKPDLNLIFEDKRKLKVATGLVIPLYIRVASIAAVGIILIGIAMNGSGSNGVAVPGAPDQPQVFASKMDTGIPQHVLAKVVRDENGKFTLPYPTNDHQKATTNEMVTQPQTPLDLVQQLPIAKQDSTIKPDETLPDDVVKNDPQNDFINPIPDPENDVVLTNFNSESAPSIVTEEPYKLVTDAAGNFTNRDINFTREKNVATNEYVAFGFKIGNFEFERKKSE